MLIGQISELSGFSQRMIRYLEDQGLLRILRSDSNLRQFNDQDLTRIMKIRKLRELGFSYDEIKSVIDQSDEHVALQGKLILERHHRDAKDLRLKIQQLEVLCFGVSHQSKMPEKMTSMQIPQRTAYRIQKLDSLGPHLDKNELKSEMVFWKFSEFLVENRFVNENFEMFEIFRQSVFMSVVFGELSSFPYVQAWSDAGFSMDPKGIGEFSSAELGNFFGPHEIVIEHRLLRAGELVLQVLLPYSAVLLASGEQ